MSEMIERVALAIETKRRELNAHPLARVYSELARAAIEAMREPTEEMKAVEGVHWDYSCAVCGGLKEGFQAMIDAALK